jgi:hypothetical protein
VTLAKNNCQCHSIAQSVTWQKIIQII